MAIGIRHSQEEKWNKIRLMIIGFDFVNQEDQGFATSAYADIIYGATRCKSVTGSRISLIPFYLHDGETVWRDGPGVKWGAGVHIPNVIAGSICSRYRIGHGFAASNYPQLLNGLLYGLKEETSGNDKMSLPELEINPISNQLLKYAPDLRLHPAYQLMMQGINCVLGNDDPLILGNPGLSYDIWILIMDGGIDYVMLKRLLFVSYIFAEKFDKDGNITGQVLSRAGIQFRKRWRGFLISNEVKSFIKDSE